MATETEYPPLYDDTLELMRDKFPDLVDTEGYTSPVPLLRDATPVVKDELFNEDTVLYIEDELLYENAGTRIIPADRVEIKEPIKLPGAPDKFVSKVGTAHVAGVRVNQFNTVHVQGNLGIPSARNRKLMITPSGGSTTRLAFILANEVSNGDPPYDDARRLGCATSFVGYGDKNYYHWIIDYLPRLRGIEWYENQTGNEVTIMGRGDIEEYDFEVDSLKYLGYWDQVETWTPNNIINKYISSHGATARQGQSLQIPSQIRWIRERMLDAVPEDEKPSITSSHIYVSREDAADRQVTNRDMVLRVLPDEFVSYELSELSFAEQVNLFRDAEMVIGPHGAGLTNILWGENIGVIELFGRKANSLYLQIASAVGHTYACEYCDYEQSGEEDEEMTVDLNRLVKLYDKVKKEHDPS